MGHQTAHTASTADGKPSRQQSADHSSMSLMSMLQSPTEVGPRPALLQHYNVVTRHTEQSKSRVCCKGCNHTFAGI